MIKKIISIVLVLIGLFFLTGVIALLHTVWGAVFCGVIMLGCFYLAYRLYPRKEKNDVVVPQPVKETKLESKKTIDTEPVKEAKPEPIKTVESEPAKVVKPTPIIEVKQELNSEPEIIQQPKPELILESEQEVIEEAEVVEEQKEPEYKDNNQEVILEIDDKKDVIISNPNYLELSNNVLAYFNVLTDVFKNLPNLTVKDLSYLAGIEKKLSEERKILPPFSKSPKSLQILAGIVGDESMICDYLQDYHKSKDFSLIKIAVETYASVGNSFQALTDIINSSMNLETNDETVKTFEIENEFKELDLFNIEDDKKEILSNEEVVINFGKYNARPAHINKGILEIDDGYKTTELNVADILSYKNVDTNFCDSCLEIKFKYGEDNPYTYSAKLFYDEDEQYLVDQIIEYINITKK